MATKNPRVSILLSTGVHEAARNEAFAQRVSMSQLFVSIIMAKVRGEVIAPPQHTVDAREGRVRPSLYLTPGLITKATKQATKQQCELPTFLSQIITEYFERRSVAA